MEKFDIIIIEYLVIEVFLSLQSLYEYIFYCGMVQQLLPIKGLHKIGDTEGVLAVEEDEFFLILFTIEICCFVDDHSV